MASIDTNRRWEELRAKLRISVRLFGIFDRKSSSLTRRDIDTEGTFRPERYERTGTAYGQTG